MLHCMAPCRLCVGVGLEVSLCAYLDHDRYCCGNKHVRILVQVLVRQACDMLRHDRTTLSSGALLILRERLLLGRH